MTLAQLYAQLFWLLDQLAAVHEAYSSDGKERPAKDPDNANISQGDYVWRLGDRIKSTREAIACREEIAAGIPSTSAAATKTP
jgi:hypothetical protein